MNSKLTSSIIIRNSIKQKFHVNLISTTKKTIFLSPFLKYNFKFYTTKTTYRINKWFFKPIEFDRFNIIFYLLKMLSNFSNNFSFIDLSSSDVGLVESSYIFSIGYHQTGPLPLLPYSPISPVILGNKCHFFTVKSLCYRFSNKRHFLQKFYFKIFI